MYVALIAIGYEVHDDYREVYRMSVTLGDDDIYTFAKAEQAVHELCRDNLCFDDDWWRIISIEATSELD